MSDYSIAASGLDAAKKALDVIGNNIANAATEGYHRQRLELKPAYSSQQGSVMLGGGVVVENVTRLIDSLLEQEIFRQKSSLEQVSKEFITLRTVENAFGELSTEDEGLNAAIDKFFNALQDLSAHPAEAIWQNQTVSEAEAMAGQFRTLGRFLTTIEAQITLEAENIIDSVNTLTSQIAELNGNIERLELIGAVANNLRDQRDRCIVQLSELIGLQTQSREYGVVDVTIAGIPAVVGTFTTQLEVGLDGNGSLGVSIVDVANYTTDVQGGKIGGLLLLKNELVSDIHDDLNSLAGAIIQQINQYHVQGVGSDGSFTSLTGWVNASEDLSDFSNVSDGSLYIRVTDTSTSPGTITRTEVVIASTDTLTDVKDAISAISGLTASVNSSNQLTITAETDYTFDFLPAVLPEPEPAPKTLTGTDPPVIAASGIYTGTTNSTLTCTVAGVAGGVDGKIGVTDGLKLQLSKDGTFVKDINVGLGYAAGDKLYLGDGLYISLSIDDGKTAGDLRLGDNFSIKGWADTDTSGLLAAVGINTFFSGTAAADIAVSSDIAAAPGRIATSLGPDMTDNTNVVRMVELKDEGLTTLSSLTCGQFYRRLVANIGQQLSIRQMREDNIEVMVQNLMNQQSEISGVDINEEATQLLVFEQMFQAMARYMNTIQASIDTIMQLI